MWQHCLETAFESSKLFSLIADEATGISHNEQICSAVRWVDSNYTIHEAALGSVQLPDTLLETLFTEMFIDDLCAPVRCMMGVSRMVSRLS